MTDFPSGTVTFLFTDIQDSTRLWEIYPSDMDQALKRHDALIENVVRQHDGVLVRPRGEGDSRFVVFIRAIDGVKAAAAIQAAMYAESWAPMTPLRVRMGIHTGEGEFHQGDYYGTAVNRCARLRGIAHGGQTLLSQTTYELVRDALPEDIDLLDLGEFPLKGLQRPEHIFQLVVPGLPVEFPPLDTDGFEITALETGIPYQLPAFLEEGVERGIDERPVFVARRRELARMNTFLEKAQHGEGGVIFITGGAGRGKTALLGEFARRSMETYSDLLVASGTSNAYAGIGDPYLPFREAMSMFSGDVEALWKAGVVSRDHAQRLWSAVPHFVGALLDRGPNLLETFVSGKELLARARSGFPHDTGIQEELRQRVRRWMIGAEGMEQSHLFEQFTNVLRDLGSKHTVLLILDDLQWADTSSTSLLFHLGRRLEGARILIAGAYRPEEVALGRDGERHPLEKALAEFKRQFGDIWIDLTQEEEDEGSRFVDAYLDSEPNHLDQDFRGALYRHTGGHALFTIELLRSMQDRGDLLQDDDGSWIEGPSIDWASLPARVEAVIEERFTRLDAEQCEILKVASVEGEDFTVQVVAEVQDIPERKLLRLLSTEFEKRHRLVHEVGGFAVDQRTLSRYSFTHILFQQYLYKQLGEGERLLLHREIARALEGMYAAAGTEQIAEQLARHYAGDVERERHYASLAGERASSRFANAEALRYFSRALDLTPDNDLERRYQLLLAREKVHNILGNRESQKEDLEKLRRLSELLDGSEASPGRAEVETRWANYTRKTDITGAPQLAEGAVSLAKLEERPEVAVKAYLILSDSLRKQGKHAPAVRQAEAGITMARDIGDRSSESRLLNVLGLVALDKRDPAAANIYFEQSLAIAREIGNRRYEAPPLNSLGNLAGIIVGDYQASEDYYQQALQIAREVGDRRGEGLVLGNLGWVVSAQGDYGKGGAYYELHRQIAHEVGDRYQETYAAINLSTSNLAQGDYIKAMEYAEQGFALARDTGDRSGEAWSLTFLGHVCLEIQALDEAAGAYQAALKIRRLLNQQNMAAEPLAGLAQVALKRVDIPAAQRYVGEILAYLDGGGTLDGAEEPQRVWLTCYRVLMAVKDPRAESVLETAHQLLQARADQISDQTLRRTFLENIPYHLEIVTAWEQQQSF